MKLHIKFINEPLAIAYKKYNFYEHKYNKKKYVENPVGMQLVGNFSQAGDAGKQ